MNEPLPPPQPKLSVWRRGNLVGAVVGYLANTTLLLAVGARPEAGWWLPTAIAGMFAGAAVGGVVERRRGGRASEVGQFLCRQGVAAVLAGQLLLGTAAGERWYGLTGRWVGLLGGVAVLAGGLVLTERGWVGRAEPHTAADRVPESE